MFRSALAAAVMVLAHSWPGAVPAQERFSPFVPSDQADVERMVKLANLRDGDTVVDLGSGDGRIIFAAIRAHPKVRGVGVDINEELVRKANDAAWAQGLSDRVQFLHRNAFDADLRNVDVIFMWLFPELMRLLRPKILAEARPGTRVVASSWDMGTWPADASDDRGGSAPTIRKWIVPAKVEGQWEWELPIRGTSPRYIALVEQRLQTVEGAVRVGTRREILSNMMLRGETMQFTLRMTLPGVGYAHHTFIGQVQGDRVEGSVLVQLTKLKAGDGEESESEELRLPWRAQRSSVSAFFDPTGTNTQ